MTVWSITAARRYVLNVVSQLLKVGRAFSEWWSALGRRSYEGVTTTRPVRHLVTALLAGFVAAGCTSSASSNTASTAPSTAAPSATTATTLDPGAQAVLNAYRRYWDVYIAVGGEMKLPDPRLGDVATGDELRTLGSAFLADKVDNEVYRGTIDVAPKVTALDGTTATVVDCYASHILGYDATSGQPKGSERPGRTLVTVSMVMESGVWKVSGIRHEGDGCTPGS